MKKIKKELFKIFKDIHNKISRNWHMMDKSLAFLSEGDIRAYIFYKLKQVCGDKYEIHIAPTLTVKYKNEYKNKAKGIKPFVQPDIIISAKKNWCFEKMKDTANRHIRIDFKDKLRVFILEIKYAKIKYNGSTHVKKDEIENDLKKLKNIKHFPNSLLVVVDYEKDLGRLTKNYQKFVADEKFLLISRKLKINDLKTKLLSK